MLIFFILNSSVKRSASCSEPPQATRIIPMLDQFASFIQGFIHDVVDVKADGNCGYRSIAALLGMEEYSWPLVRNELIKELGKWSHEYMNLFGGIERSEQLKLSLLVDGFSKVSVDKWMDITEMGYVIASRYNVILVSLSRQQSMTFFPLRSQPPPDSSGHRMICVGHVFGNHFVQVYLKDHCPLPPPALLWSSNCYSQAKQWTTPYISRMQQYTSLMSFKRHYFSLINFWMWLYDNLNVLVYDAYVLKMDEDQWRYDYAMSQEVHMDYDYDNEEECGVNEPHVDCSNAFNTYLVLEMMFCSGLAHENGFVAVIMRFDTETGSKGRNSFVLIGCERSGTYKCRNKEFACGKPVHGREGWTVKLICGIHNHELAKSLVGHPYVGRLTKDEKKIIADMTKSMVKPKNILLTLKEHNANSCTTIKQIYNARSEYRSSIRGADTEMQHLMKLLERDQYIHWHRLKDEVVVRDLFWCHPNVVKLCNACHLVFFIDSTYKTNRYRLPLLDFVGVTPTMMTFSARFAYLEAERVSNIVWALERFRCLFLKNDCLPVVIVTDRDLALMNAVKTVFPECTNLLCRFHIDKNVKAKCKCLIGEKTVWDYVMDNWGTLVDCPFEHQFHESLQKFQVACSPWPMLTDYVNNTWIIPHKEKFITAWTNKVMHLGNTTTKRVESAHWALKRVLQNSVGDLCSVWDAMNNMITLQHVKNKASFETSTHMVGHVYRKTLYKRLLGMVSRDALNQIASEVDRLRYLGNNPISCGCVMRTTHGLPCACELSRYTVGCIPLELRRLCFSDQGLCETEVSIKQEIETISKRFDELDVFDKVTLKSKLREIAYPDHNSMCPPPSKVNTKGAPKKPMKRSQRSTKRDPSYWEYVDAFHSVQSSNSPVKRSASCSEPPQPTRIIPMLDQFASFIQGFIRDVVDVKADGNCGYWSIAALLGMGKDSWPLVRNELIKELGRWSHEYMNLFSGTERFEQLKLSLLVDGFSKVSVDKWMDITEMGYVIASRYNVILVSLSRQQSMTFFPLRSQPPPDFSGHRMICVGHVFGNHFVQVYLKDHCPLPPPALLWSSNCYSQAKQWTTPYISRMQQYTSLMSFKRHYVDLNED
ncbi:Protein FAR1-RELATED SEQUENCE 5 [Glycine max]|nr:Protein FAR1-RELATED SEQUENCE 5 [Glycine max]